MNYVGNGRIFVLVGTCLEKREEEQELAAHFDLPIFGMLGRTAIDLNKILNSLNSYQFCILTANLKPLQSYHFSIESKHNVVGFTCH